MVYGLWANRHPGYRGPTKGGKNHVAPNVGHQGSLKETENMERKNHEEKTLVNKQESVIIFNGAHIRYGTVIDAKDAVCMHQRSKEA